MWEEKELSNINIRLKISMGNILYRAFEPLILSIELKKKWHQYLMIDRFLRNEIKEGEITWTIVCQFCAKI